MRYITPEITEDNFFSSLPDDTYRLIWILTILVLADDQGRFIYSPALIRSKLFPYSDIPIKKIDGIYKYFFKNQKILLYSNGRSGESYCQLASWPKYQSGARWAKPSRYPAPPKWVDRIRYQASGSPNNPVTVNWDKPGGLYSSLNRRLHRPLYKGLSTGLDSDSDSDSDKHGASAVREGVKGGGSKQDATATARRSANRKTIYEKLGVPVKYWEGLDRVRVLDISAGLAQAIHDKTSKPVLVMASNLSRGDPIPENCYARDYLYKYLPQGTRHLLLKGLSSHSHNGNISGYTNKNQSPSPAPGSPSAPDLEQERETVAPPGIPKELLQIWTRGLEEFRRDTGGRLDKCTLREYDHRVNTLYIQADNPDDRDWLDDRFKTILRKYLAGAIPLISIDFELHTKSMAYEQ